MGSASACASAHCDHAHSVATAACFALKAPDRIPSAVRPAYVVGGLDECAAPPPLGACPSYAVGGPR